MADSILSGLGCVVYPFLMLGMGLFYFGPVVAAFALLPLEGVAHFALAMAVSGLWLALTEYLSNHFQPLTRLNDAMRGSN